MPVAATPQAKLRAWHPQTFYRPIFTLYAAIGHQPDRTARHVTRQATYRERATDWLSALFLLLAMALAGGHGPLSAPAQAQPANAQSGTAAGDVGRRSVPVISKQQLFASESEDDKAAAWHDGTPKAALPGREFELAAVPAGIVRAEQAAEFLVSAAASPFEARGPPARS